MHRGMEIVQVFGWLLSVSGFLNLGGTALKYFTDKYFSYKDLHSEGHRVEYAVEQDVFLYILCHLGLI